MMMKRLMVLLLVLVLGAAACAQNGGGGDEAAGGDAGEAGGDGTEAAGEDQGEAEGEPIIVGHAADFSDVYSFYDIPIRDGFQFAVEEINAEGGVLGRPLELRTSDGRNDQALTLEATQGFIDQGASYLIGTTGDPFIAQAQLACSANIPISTGDGTAPTLVQDAGECAYQLVMSDNLQGAAAAEYAREQGYETAFVVGSSEIPYTENLPEYFQEVFEAEGGEVVGEAEYRIESAEFGPIVTRIRNADPQPDVIFTPMFVPDTPVFVRQLRAAGVDIPVISTDGAHDASLLEAGDAVEGMTFTTHGLATDGNALDELFSRYEEAEGSRPESPVFGVGYDEAHLLAQAIEDAGSAEPADIMEGLANVDGVEGATGTVTMDPETRRSEKTIALVSVENGEFTLVDERTPETVPDP